MERPGRPWALAYSGPCARLLLKTAKTPVEQRAALATPSLSFSWSLSRAGAAGPRYNATFTAAGFGARCAVFSASRCRELGNSESDRTVLRKREQQSGVG